MTWKRAVLVLLAVLPLVPVAGLALLSARSRKPPVLGVSEGRLKPCPASPNCVCSQSDDAEHRVPPFEYGGTAEQALDALNEVISRRSGALVVERGPTYLRAEFRSRLFRFIDDVEFAAGPDEGQLHVRSASRAGYSDLGANRARVESLRAEFREALAR